jgi:hypothetical protein
MRVAQNYSKYCPICGELIELKYNSKKGKVHPITGLVA